MVLRELKHLLPELKNKKYNFYSQAEVNFRGKKNWFSYFILFFPSQFVFKITLRFGTSSNLYSLCMWSPND